MICKQCKQAFNGASGICHLCGTDHSDPIEITKVTTPSIESKPEADIVEPDKVAIKKKVKAKK